MDRATMMRRRAVALAWSLAGCTGWAGIAWGAVPAKPPDACAACHLAQEGDARGPATEFQHDIHAKRGLSCADCHGGDPTSDDPGVAMDPAHGFVGTPARQDIPQLCARCHADPAYMRKYNPNLSTDQYLKYQTSQHGKRNAQGDPDAAVCVSCHGAHGVLSKKDPASPVYATNIPGTCAQCHADSKIMDKHGLPIDQHWKYARSVHGQALLVKGDRAAPHCASCHGSHEASKPGAIAVGNVCAQCHSLVRDLFANSPHKAVHEALGLPECEVCHSNHLIQKPSDEMLGTGDAAVCITCHAPDSPGFHKAQQMRAAIESLKAGLASAQADVNEAAQLGMDMGDAAFALQEAESQLTQARAYVHTFSPQAMQPIVDEGKKKALEADREGKEAIRQFRFRRHGLWVTLVIIGVLLVGLLLMIRELGSPPESRDRK